MNSQLKKISFEVKYMAGSYLDCSLSIPIWAAEKIAKGSERFFGDRNPSILSWNNIKERSEIYHGREKLRTSLDTRPGALYLKSNAMAGVTMFLAGMPAAEYVGKGIENVLSGASQVVGYVGNSLATTLGVQMPACYTSYMVDQAFFSNRDKYLEGGKRNWKKIGGDFCNAIKTFALFDLTYIGAKSVLQTAFLAMDKNPAEASAIADSVALPLFYAMAISLGLRNGLFQTKSSRDLYSSRDKSDDGLVATLESK